MKLFLSSLVLILAAACSRQEPAHAADHTGKNVTPTDQSESEADREVTRQIRQALLAPPELSTNAKNIKVITQNGKVTLRGLVDSQSEKDDVATRAREVPGLMELDNQLEVKRN
jgi:osmotically-inducible protein OsmY